MLGVWSATTHPAAVFNEDVELIISPENAGAAASPMSGQRPCELHAMLQPSTG